MIQPPGDERRFGGRRPFAERVMVVRGHDAWFAEALDLSENGCAIVRPEACDLLDEELVRLFFYDGLDKPAVVVPARVARAGDARIGFEYHGPQTVPPSRPAR
ncbi:PilZ domain-containing protein [Marilutibacter chinensis]|uniref:PilZ domain-containing protein n=1 Tax=Marilutibacter chinensis TaxID=2912247 RepID=A0ABS9HMM6_9GAMM|nr:PilZ domain-containing protein [Lysobacter chinensis]MCF7220276.1 PilZ domain-containing protein [Lysobacter chinensis]